MLSRARAIALEHDDLTSKLARGFDAKIAKRIGELSSTSSAVKEYDKAQASLGELQDLLRSPDEELQALAEDDVEATQNAIELAAKTVKSSLVPVHPFAHLPCLVEIHPGAGGDEAGIFAGDLLRMYQSFCAFTGLRCTMLKLETTDHTTNVPGRNDANVAEAVLEVDSPGAYGILRCEAGVHRVQRVPATETKGRTHTSAASVIVLPSLPSSNAQSMDFDDPKSDHYVDAKDVQTDVMRASGAGGQHVNKTESAVRLTHVPSNTVVAVQSGRSQLQNRERAWQILRSRIAQQRREVREEEIAKLRKTAGAGKTARENKIRTYNWGQQRVSDHRSGFDSRNLDSVMAGGEALEVIMESVRAWMAEQEILTIVAEDVDECSR